MRCLKRNKRSFSYALFIGKYPIQEDDGTYTGENVMAYRAAVTPKANFTPASGSSTIEQFGNVQDYDRVIITDDLDCPIDENSIIWIDKIPVITETFSPVVPDEGLSPDDALYPAETAYGYENYNYVVKHIARGLYSVAYATSKVDDHVE